MDKSLAQVAYEAYAESTGWKSLVSGAVLPAWDLVKPEIQASWQAAALAICKATQDSVKPVAPSYRFDLNVDRDQDVIANKELRRRIDADLQNLKCLPPSRERALSITKLQEAVMWLGMDLKRLNEPNPYPNSKNPANTLIEPTADNLKL